MIDDELLAKFDRIQDLPVSEEMLGAYMEGNLSDGESFGIYSMIYDNPDLSSIIDGISAFDAADLISMPTVNEDVLFNSASFLDSVLDDVVNFESFHQVTEYDFSDAFTSSIDDDMLSTADVESPETDFVNDDFSAIDDSFGDNIDSTNQTSDDAEDNELFNDNQDSFS